MPNHMFLLRFEVRKACQSIQWCEGKRFMSYGIVKRLKNKGEEEILKQLAELVNPTDRKRGKVHEVFEPSFDWKECRENKLIDQKLNYIHANPCRGAWNLVADECDYLHSSAKFYATGEHGTY